MLLVFKHLKLYGLENCFTTPLIADTSITIFLFLPLNWEEFDFRNTLFVLNRNINKLKN